MSLQRLHQAALQGNAEALRRELDLGVSPDATDWHGLICQSDGDGQGPGRLACIRLLAEAGADLNVALDTTMGLAPLHVAASYGRARIAAALLEAGANVNQLSDSAEESSPLHLACESSRSLDCIVVLIRAGATVNARDYQGKSPLDRADSDFSRRLASPRKIRRIYANLLRAGAELPTRTEDEYLRKVIAAGSFQNYERAHLNALAGIFAPKFSRLLPPEMVRRVLEFAYPVGDH